VRKAFGLCICLALLAATGTAAQKGAESTPPGDQFVGTWAGTWDSAGSGSGGFELTLETAKDGSIGGKVSVTGEPTYKATLETVSFEGQKMTARYDFPPDESIGIVLTAAFAGDTAKGTWAARVKASGEEMAAGTWTVTKK
jgi:hypothetical protein